MLKACKFLSRWKKETEDTVKVDDMEESIRVKLSVKPNSKVCLFHAPKELLSPFMKGDLKLLLDWAENECDSIIYWVKPQDDIKDIAQHLEKQIKPSGRIWIIVQDDKGTVKEIVTQLQEYVIEYTNLLKGKVVSIGNGYSAVQFVLRKDAKEPKD